MGRVGWGKAGVAGRRLRPAEGVAEDRVTGWSEGECLDKSRLSRFFDEPKTTAVALVF